MRKRIVWMPALRCCTDRIHLLQVAFLMNLIGVIWPIAGVEAQPIVPNADGTGTQVVTPDGQKFTITGGTQAGSNLFHSFQRFGLEPHQVATFLSQPDIANILSRVNGGDPSVINGLLQVTGGSSHLYLLNPAGILFGPHARLDIPGSFTATTATGIGFAHDRFFSALGRPDYPKLVGNPALFQFGLSQPGSIVNVGTLAVGDDLNLLAGTIVNTGKLSVTNGQLTLTTVPGASLLRLSQPGSLLSLDIQPLSSVFPVGAASLAQLLTGGGLASHASGLTVNADGSVSLSGSGIGIKPGDLAVARVGSSLSGGNVTLQAAANLTLAETQITSQGNLHLLAHQQLFIRDSTSQPFLAQAGGNLTLQGTRKIDILALNHQPLDAFQSGGSLSLISDGLISGDAHFSSGGPFSIRRLSGGMALFQSLYDPIISTNSSVDIFADYTGTSLLVEATGDIRFQGNITITGPDILLATAGPDTALLQSSSALILRSGQAALSYAPGSYAGNNPAPSFSPTAVPTGITVAGNITLSPPAVGGATVSLTAASGNINVQSITTNGGTIVLNSAGGITTNGQNLTTTSSGNGGAITLVGGGNISTGNLQSFSQVIGVGTSDNGGAITLNSGGNIDTGDLLAFSRVSSSGSSGNGGAITLTSSGSINTGSLQSASRVFGSGLSVSANGSSIILSSGGNISVTEVDASSRTGNGSSGNGGFVTFNSGGGITSSGSVQSSSRVDFNGTAGNAGTIAFTANGQVTIGTVLGGLESFTIVAFNGSAGSAGSVNVSTTSGNISIPSIDAYTLSSASANLGSGGDINLSTGGGNISVGNLTTYARTMFNGNLGNGGAIRLNATGDINTSDLSTNTYTGGGGSIGNAGSVSVQAGRNITINDVTASTVLLTPGSAGDAGNISLNAANGSVSHQALLAISQALNGGNTGNGGQITIVANTTNGVITTNGANLFSYTEVASGTGNSGNAGSINLLAAQTNFGNSRLIAYSSQMGTGNAGDGGSIAVNLTAGNLFVTNGFFPIATYSEANNGNAANAGSVSLIASGSLTVSGGTSITAYSRSASNGQAGDGGNVTIQASSISTVNINATSSRSGAGSGNAGNGGSVTLITTGGGLTTANINTSTTANASAGSAGAIGLNATTDIVAGALSAWASGGIGNSGNGGTVSLQAGQSITVNDIVAVTSVQTGNVGNAGHISLNAANGNINHRSLQALSRVFTDGNTGDGGSITIIANTTSGVVTTNGGGYFSYTEATGAGNSGNAGSITLMAAQTNLGSSRLIAYAAKFSGVGNVGSGGNIAVNITNGNLAFTNFSPVETYTQTPDGNAASAGSVSLVVSGNLTFGGGAAISTFSRSSNNGQAGNGGDIIVQAANIVAASISATSVRSGGGSGNAGNGGSVTLNTTSSSLTASSISTGTAANANAGSAGAIRLNVATSLAIGSLSSDVAGTVTGGGGGEIAIATGGNLSLGTVNSAGSLRINSTGAMAIANIATAGAVSLDATAAIQTGDITGNGITLTSNNGNISSGDITSSYEGGVAAPIMVQAINGNLILGNLTASGVSGGGDITLIGLTTITAGNFNTSSTGGSGGSVRIDPTGDVQIGFINAQSSNGTGGSIDLFTGSLLRVTGTFVDLEGQTSSISTAGSLGGGSIIVRHGGGTATPFVVGSATLSGSAARITTGTWSLTPLLSLPSGIFTQGNIQFITAGTSPLPPPVIPTPVPPPVIPTPVPDVLELARVLTPIEMPSLPNFAANDVTGVLDLGVTALEQSLSREFTAYLGDSGAKIPQISLAQAVQVLQRVEAATGIKPALLYVNFIASLPNRLSSPVGLPQSKKSLHSDWSNRDLSNIASSHNEQPIWQFGGFNLSINALDRPSTPQDDDQLELLLVTGRGAIVRRRIPVTRGQVLALVLEFRQQVTDPDSNTYLPMAERLHSWLVQPILADLEQRGINNLVFLLDAGLRTLPLAALHNGQRYLVEDYSIGLMPSLALTDVTYANIQRSPVLAMGASTFPNQPPLPAVPKEISLIRDLRGGASILNQDFTLANLRQQRLNSPFPILHLATHGEFKAGDIRNSYIQFSDAKLSLDQVRNLNLSEPLVELLVLSACRTAVGSEEAELGFAGLAFKAGVRSVLGSLWYVSDEGTLGLMSEFYQELTTSPIRAEALRQAQLAMLRGQVFLQAGKLVNSYGSFSLPADLVNLENRRLNHPYYWSAFTMIGSPW